MNDIYLIRHGRPAFPGEGSFCIGTTDLPLDPAAGDELREQAAHFRTLEIGNVFTSPLLRAVQTAELLFPELPAMVVPSLRERSLGVFDGLSFREIKERYPEIYEKRGADPGAEVPGEEAMAEALGRFSWALRRIVRGAEDRPGAIAIVSHTDVISLFAADLAGKPDSFRDFRLPYGGFFHLKYQKETDTFNL